MEILASFDELHEILGTGAIVLAIVVAALVGTRPWRLAAVVLGVELVGSLLLASIDRYDRVTLTHGKSVLVALLLAMIVLRHRTFGLILLLSLQLLALLIHFAVWLEPTILARVNALVLNAIGWAILVVLLAGSVQSRVRSSSQRLPC